ncbi:MAG: hypothetical protein QM714_04860 [Nocardioides sp.]|uniref:hypothetical protein n=1 Tax=Nocardioides sp. TaxID=35761 RepID=UPI0039E358A7
MATLQIEHAITDLDVWITAFGRFEQGRVDAGVRGQRICQVSNAPHVLVIELDFDDAEAAARFEGFLRTQVWSSPDRAPALVGSPETRILEPIDIARATS